jgi:hypothetical protein
VAVMVEFIRIPLFSLFFFPNTLRWLQLKRLVAVFLLFFSLW